VNRTRISLFYLVGYLIPTGLGLMFAPRLMLKLLLSNGQYDDIFPRFAGVLMVALGIIVVQAIRARSEALYPVTLVVRAVIWLWVLHLYAVSGDPFFLVILAVIGLGMAVTGTFYVIERRNRSKSVVSSSQS
jgi:uncharacterized protein YjeT (DUF2065 family)